MAVVRNELRAVACAAFLLSFTALLPAQVPDGWYVFSSFAASSVPGPGGLAFVHPRTPGLVTPVTGLPPDLTGVGSPGTQGASSVLRRPSDGALVVGEVAPVGAGIELRIVTLIGSTVGGVATYFLGTVAATPPLTSGEIVQCALTPAGTVVVGLNNVGAPGPLAGSILGTVSPPTGAITPVPVIGLPAGNLNAIALDSTGTILYLGYIGAGGGPSSIYSVPLAGGAVTFIATLPATPVTNLAVDNAGYVLASCNESRLNRALYSVSPTSGAVTPIPTGYTGLNAIAVERVTGNIAATAVSYPGTIYWITPSGTVTTLASPPPSGWGVPSGIDVNPDPEAYGAGSPGLGTYSWALTPNPGGLPTVGNLSFSLALYQTASNPGLFGASLAPTVLPVSGIVVLIDLATLVFLLPVPPAPSPTVPVIILLPIPAAPGVSGLTFYCQSVHMEPAGLAASGGVMLTIL